MAMKKFGEIFDEVWQHKLAFQDSEILKSLAEELKELSPTAVGVGHPDYADIQIGETQTGQLVVFFIDIRGFTKLSIVKDNSELVRILGAVTGATILFVRQYSGYVGEFTGDGLMAYFGGRHTNEEDAWCGIFTACLLMDGIKNVVCNYLMEQGDEAVRVGMAIEYGDVLWTRIGTPQHSEIKPVSEVAFIAGKSSSHAKSWQCVLGCNIAEWVSDEYKDRFDTYEFDFAKKHYKYERALLKWESLVKEIKQYPALTRKSFVERQLPGNKLIPTTSSSMVTLSEQIDTGRSPKKLKDHPYFKNEVV
ncbi:MAG: adenylate/guanylate cyclase domain-containing protein [Deltaproteobacteria bacterium]|nr:adenylate/guanylate cyclase domain-containing protein [Deltaproteobacteria bacterium]